MLDFEAESQHAAGEIHKGQTPTPVGVGAAGKALEKVGITKNTLTVQSHPTPLSTRQKLSASQRLRRQREAQQGSGTTSIATAFATTMVSQDTSNLTVSLPQVSSMPPVTAGREDSDDDSLE